MHAQSNVRLAVGWSISLLCLLFLGLATRPQTAQLPPPESLEVQELVLVNAEGDRRATLSLIRDKPVLQLFDTQGELQVTLGLADEGPALLVKDKSGKIHNFLDVTPALTPTPAGPR